MSGVKWLEVDLRKGQNFLDVSEGGSPPSTGIPNACDDEYGMFYEADRDENFSYSAL